MEKIREEYKLFGIPEENIPEYEDNPNEFMTQYKKCSILKNSFVFYSDSSCINKAEEKECAKLE